MRLNFRYEQQSSSARGLTPMLIPGSAAGLPLHSPTSPTSQTSLSTATPRPFSIPSFYISLILLLLTLPFLIPIAISRTLLLFESTHNLPSSSPRPHPWSKFSVIRNGNLHLSDTFQARLNAQIAPSLPTLDPPLFQPCPATSRIAFVLHSSPAIQAQVEIVVPCGRDTACVQHPHIYDLNRLYLNGPRHGRRHHYLTVDPIRGAKGRGRRRQVWGPLLRPIKVSLLDNSVVAIRKSCSDGRASVTRLMSIAEIMKLLSKRGFNREAFTYHEEEATHVWNERTRL